MRAGADAGERRPNSDDGTNEGILRARKPEQRITGHGFSRWHHLCLRLRARLAAHCSLLAAGKRPVYACLRTVSLVSLVSLGVLASSISCSSSVHSPHGCALLAQCQHMCSLFFCGDLSGDKCMGELCCSCCLSCHQGHHPGCSC